MTTLEAALWYIRGSWPVLPCRGKVPILPDWPVRATTDEAEVRRLFGNGENVGIVMGRRSGLIAIDCDGAAGIEAWGELANAHGDDEGKPILAQSGSGQGIHIIYAYHARCEPLRNMKRIGGRPIDLKTNNGQIIVYPSLHPSGGQYRWLTDPEQTASPMPRWLVDCLLNLSSAKAPSPAQPRRTYTDDLGQVVTRAIRYLAKIPGAVNGCGGHDQTFAAARDMVYGFDLGPDVGLNLLANYYNPRCDPPWSYKELLHKCHDADTKPFDKPRGYLRNAVRS